jgi:hypothetical protein
MRYKKYVKKKVSQKYQYGLMVELDMGVMFSKLLQLELI